MAAVSAWLLVLLALSIGADALDKSATAKHPHESPVKHASHVDHKATPKSHKIAVQPSAITKKHEMAGGVISGFEEKPSVSVDPVVQEERKEEAEKIMKFEEDAQASEALRLRTQGFPHTPLLTRPSVEHLTGKRPELEESTESGTRSIVLTPSYGPTSGGIWVQVVGAGSFHTPNSLQCKLDLVEQFCYSNHYFYSWCYLTPKCAGVYPFHCHNGPLQYEGKYAVVAKTPWVTSVYPFSGDTNGGTPVTVRGWNFEPHCPQHLLCRFGEQVVPAKYYTSSSIMCIAPCNSEKGFVSVEVSNDGGMHWSMSGVQYGYVGDNVDLASGECQRYIAADYHQKPSH